MKWLSTSTGSFALISTKGSVRNQARSGAFKHAEISGNCKSFLPYGSSAAASEPIRVKAGLTGNASSQDESAAPAHEQGPLQNDELIRYDECINASGRAELNE